MMFTQLSTQVNTDLRAITDLTALLSKGVDSVRPLMAEADDGDNLVVYRVKNNGRATKDLAQEWQVVVTCWATTYNAAVQIADEVIVGLLANRKYRFVGGEPQFNEQGQIYTELIFNILK